MATFYEIWAHLCHYYLSTGIIPNAKYEIRGRGNFPLDISIWVNKPISSVDKKILDRINNGSFMDLACGTGRHLKYLENKHSCDTLYGIDNNPVTLNIAKSQLAKTSLMLDDINMYITKSIQKYDFVSLFGNSICDIGDYTEIQAFLVALKNILSPTGRLIVGISEPSENNLYSRGNNYISYVHRINLNNTTSEWKKVCRLTYYGLHEIATNSGYIEEHIESDGRKYCIMYKIK